jgi:hypothetical protein
VHPNDNKANQTAYKNNCGTYIKHVIFPSGSYWPNGQDLY